METLMHSPSEKLNLRNETVISIKCSVYRKQSIISQIMNIHQEFISIFKLIITA